MTEPRDHAPRGRRKRFDTQPLIDAWAALLRHRDRRITRCVQGYWHANGAGPCHDTKAQAIAFRDYEEAHPDAWRFR